jgi:hypothetical protein
MSPMNKSKTTNNNKLRLNSSYVNKQLYYINIKETEKHENNKKLLKW